MCYPQINHRVYETDRRIHRRSSPSIDPLITAYLYALYHPSPASPITVGASSPAPPRPSSPERPATPLEMPIYPGELPVYDDISKVVRTRVVRHANGQESVRPRRICGYKNKEGETMIAIFAPPKDDTPALPEETLESSSPDPASSGESSSGESSSKDESDED